MNSLNSLQSLNSLPYKMQNLPYIMQYLPYKLQFLPYIMQRPKNKSIYNNDLQRRFPLYNLINLIKLSRETKPFALGYGLVSFKNKIFNKNPIQVKVFSSCF